MTLDLTKEECAELVRLLDIAVKAGGLVVAQTALPLAVKLQGAAAQVESTRKPRTKT